MATSVEMKNAIKGGEFLIRELWVWGQSQPCRRP